MTAPTAPPTAPPTMAPVSEDPDEGELVGAMTLVEVVSTVVNVVDVPEV